MIKFQRLALPSALGAAFFGFSAAATAAGTGEFCVIPNAQGTNVSVECNVKYLPTQADWLTQFKTWATANKSNGAMACFAPGTYTVPATFSSANNPAVDTNRLVLRGVKNMKLCAPSGGAIVEHKTVNADATPLLAYIVIPTLQISDSSGVTIKGMDFRNKSDYAVNAAQHVTRAVWAERSANTRFFDSNMSGLGKQVLMATDSSVSLNNAKVSCAYFCASAERGNGSIKPTINIAKSAINIHHTKNAADDHAALWTEFSDFNISDTNFNFTTGEGFVAGKASTVDWVNVKDVTITGTTAAGKSKMFGWIAMNPAYSNLQINHTATQYANRHWQFGRPYFCINYLNAGCETGYENAGNSGSVFKYREDATSAYVTAALPPARTQRLLLVNGAGQDGFWSKLAIVKNNPGLRSDTIQPWSSMSTLGGWMDPGDTMLTGDFLVKGERRALFFNSETLGGAVSVRNLAGTGNSGTTYTDLHIDWTPALINTLKDWHGPNDKVLAGDFYGLGRAHVLFWRANNNGGDFHLSAVDAASNQMRDLAVVYGTPAEGFGSGFIWRFPGNRMVAGDFLGTGRAQVMMFNDMDPDGDLGAAAIRQYDAVTNSFPLIASVYMANVVGDRSFWRTASTKTLTGDFLGLRKDQVMFINTTGTGTAISIWAVDAPGFAKEVHKMNYAPNEIPVGGFNGYLDSNDWQLAY
jgi:hypothetical protein